jgi:uncharacterized protein DUF6893
MKTLSMVAKVVGVATLAYAGFIILASLPDLRRYVRISNM